jgi:transcriptional regulator with XRE-family HTH domain
MATFGEKLRQLRGEAGLTQEELARQAGLGLGAVRDYEQGRKGPSVASLFKLAGALGVSCEAFKDCVGDGQAAESPPAKTGRRKT